MVHSNDLNEFMIYSRNTIWLTLILTISFILFSKDCILILQYDLAVGVDGYYYVLQIESYTANGNLFFPSTTPLIFFIIAASNFLFQNPLLSIKVCTILFECLLIVGIFGVVLETLGNYLYATVGVLLFLVSGLHLYFLAEYINQLGALALFIWSVFFLLKTKGSPKGIIWVLLAVILFLAASFSHRSVILTTGVLLCGVVLFVMLNWAKQTSRKKEYKATCFLFVLLFLIPALLTFFPITTILGDLASSFTLIPNFPSHFGTLPEMIILMGLAPLCLWLLLFGPNDRINNISKLLFGAIAIFTLLVSLNPFISSSDGFLSLGGRLRTLACLQIALLLPCVLYMANLYSRRLFVCVLTFVAPLFLWSFFSPVPHGVQSEYLARRELLINALRKQDLFEDKSIIIAEHGDQFVLTAITSKSASKNFPLEPAKYTNVYWLVSGVPGTMIDGKMKILFIDKVGTYTVIVKHDNDWLKRLSNSDFRNRLVAINPHLYKYLYN